MHRAAGRRWERTLPERVANLRVRVDSTTAADAKLAKERRVGGVIAEEKALVALQDVHLRAFSLRSHPRDGPLRPCYLPPSLCVIQLLPPPPKKPSPLLPRACSTHHIYPSPESLSLNPLPSLLSHPSKRCTLQGEYLCPLALHIPIPYPSPLALHSHTSRSPCGCSV